MSFTLTAAPTVNVGGIPIAVHGTTGAYLAIDELTITWGRQTLFEHPTPATAQLTILDQDKAAGYPIARRSDWIGQPVTLGVQFSDTTTLTNFRGRITDMSVYPVAAGFAMTLACSSKEVDLGNYTVLTDATWTPETAENRKGRIAARLPAGFLPGGVTLPYASQMGLPAGTADPGTNTVAQPDLGTNTDVHTLLRQLWDSCYPAPMIYDPAADGIRAGSPVVFHRHANHSTPTGRLLTGPQRAGLRVLMPEQVLTPDTTATGTGVNFDARSIGYDGDLSQALEAHLSMVQISYRTQTSATGAPLAYTTSTTTAGVNLDEDSRGRRTLAIDTILTGASAAATLASYWADLAVGAPSHRRLGTLSYATANSHNGGGFETGAHGRLLLAGCEQATPAFLAGTWLPTIGARPMVRLIGAALRYAAGDWTVAATPHPVRIASTGTETPLTIAAAANDGTTLAQVDPSVTFGDLGWVDIGAGYTAATQPPLGTG